jgi:hypothetical protein
VHQDDKSITYSQVNHCHVLSKSVSVRLISFSRFSTQRQGGLNEISFRFVCMKYLGQLMILTKSKQVKEMTETLQIKKKAIAVIKLVFKMINFSIKSSYNSRNITALETS